MSLYDTLTKIPVVGGVVHAFGGDTSQEKAHQAALDTAAQQQKQYQAYQLASLMNGYQPGIAQAFSPMQSFMDKWYGPGAGTDVGAAMKGMNPGQQQLGGIYQSAFGGPDVGKYTTAQQQSGANYDKAEKDWKNNQGGQGNLDNAKERMTEAERNYLDATTGAANATNSFNTGEAAFWGPNSGYKAAVPIGPGSASVNALPDFWNGALNSPYKTKAGY